MNSNSNSSNSNSNNSSNSSNSSNEEINVANLFKKKNSKTLKRNRKVSWKNKNNVRNINYNYPEERRESRKSIKNKGFPNNTNLSDEDLKIVNKVLKRNSKFTPKERSKLRKEVVKFLKEKSKKYDLHHLEEFEKDFLEFEAMR